MTRKPDHPAPLLERLDEWRARVARTYFELALDYRDPLRFSGRLESVELDDVTLSRLASDPLRYRRLATHLGADRDEHFLVTVPECAPVTFAQRGRSTVCGPGSFTVERSGAPYEFSYDAPNRLRVLKVSEKALRRRIGAPDRLCAIRFDAASGAGALFVDYLALIAQRAEGLSATSRALLGAQLLDLLTAVVDGAGDLADSAETSVRAAHRRRIEHYIRSHLGDATLAPAAIAAATGVSLRYLHRLFSGTGQTVAEYIRELRLAACHEALTRGVDGSAIGALAYQWGFADQAHFTRLFKARYGIAPGEARRRAREERRSP